MSNQADIQEILAVLDERELSDDLFLGDIDADSPALQPIVAAWQEEDTERCRSLLANHFRTRQRPKWRCRGGYSWASGRAYYGQSALLPRRTN